MYWEIYPAFFLAVFAPKVVHHSQKQTKKSLFQKFLSVFERKLKYMKVMNFVFLRFINNGMITYNVYMNLFGLIYSTSSHLFFIPL